MDFALIVISWDYITSKIIQGSVVYRGNISRYSNLYYYCTN